MRLRAGRFLSVPVVAGMVLLPACGGGGGSTTPTPPTTLPPVPPSRSVVASGAESGLAVNHLLFVGFVTSAAGTLDVTVDWTIPADRIHIFLSANECSLEDINAEQCRLLIDSPPSSVKPRVVTLTGLAVGTYTLYIGNRGPDEESVSWQVGLTTGGTAAGSVNAHARVPGLREDWTALVRR